jgi:hypothetical protein
MAFTGGAPVIRRLENPSKLNRAKNHTEESSKKTLSGICLDTIKKQKHFNG